MLNEQQRLISAKNKIQIAILAEDKAMYWEAIQELRELRKMNGGVK
ncbi:MAG: hypothetical protein ACRDD9_23735 [Shewanella sp.]